MQVGFKVTMGKAVYRDNITPDTGESNEGDGKQNENRDYRMVWGIRVSRSEVRILVLGELECVCVCAYVYKAASE